MDEIKNKHIKEFEQFEILPILLKAILKIKYEIPCCTGVDGCGGLYPIIACVKTKNVDGCWNCDNFETYSKLNFLIPFHGNSIIKNLRLIKK